MIVLVDNTQDRNIMNILLGTADSLSQDVHFVAVHRDYINESVGKSTKGLVLTNRGERVGRTILDFKNKYPYIPVVLLTDTDLSYEFFGADINLPLANYQSVSQLRDLIASNILKYNQNFEKLQRIFVDDEEIIEFGSCQYDPVRRTLYHKGKELNKLSKKQGDILEVLAKNFDQPVKKDFILEKVWGKTDYFTSRSMDVYISNLRKFFKENKINLSIKNIIGVGIILK